MKSDKSVLVIDTPRSCAECTLRTSLEANYLYCIATLPRLKIDPMTAYNIKEHRCPLRPLPKEKEWQDYINSSDDEFWKQIVHYINGWNACLSQITGETE